MVGFWEMVPLELELIQSHMAQKPMLRGALRIVIGYYTHCQNTGFVLFLFSKIPPTFKNRLKMKMMSDYYYNVICTPKFDHFTQLFSHRRREARGLVIAGQGTVDGRWLERDARRR